MASHEKLRAEGRLPQLQLHQEPAREAKDAHICVLEELPPSHGASRQQQECRRKRSTSMRAPIIVAVALVLLLVAVLVVGATRWNSSTQAHNISQSTKAQPVPTTSPPSTLPSDSDLSLVWCQPQGDGDMCTLGVHQNLETGQISAQVYDQTCRALGRSDQIQLDTSVGLNSSLPATITLVVHGLVGSTDEFWYNGTHYSDGWTWQNPAPVWYQTQVFRCL